MKRRFVVRYTNKKGNMKEIIVLADGLNELLFSFIPVDDIHLDTTIIISSFDCSSQSCIISSEFVDEE